MRKYILLFFIVLFFKNTHSQTKSFHWVKGIESTNSSAASSGQDLIVDSVGNTYLLGVFKGTVDFDPSVNTYTLTTGYTTNIYDSYYLAKYDSLGNFLWVKNLGRTANIEINENCLKFNSNGDLLIAGTLLSSNDFDPSSSVYSASSLSADFFLLKLDNQGLFLNLQHFKVADEQRAYSLSVDINDNIFITGLFKGTVDFDNSANTFTLTCVNLCPFILKLNPNASFLWANALVASAPQYDRVYVTTTDQYGNYYCSGMFIGSVDMDPGAGTTMFNTRTDDPESDAFILKLDANGVFVWAKMIQSPGYMGNGSEPEKILIDNNGNVYTSGRFYDNVDFDPSTGSTYYVTAYTKSSFLLKLNSQGLFKWVDVFMDPSGYSDVDVQGMNFIDNGIVLAGRFDTRINFNPRGAQEIKYSYVTDSLLPSGSYFVLKLDTQGYYNNFIQRNGPITSMNCDKQGNIYTTGYYSRSCNFSINPPYKHFLYVPSGFTSNNSYIHKIGNCGIYNYSLIDDTPSLNKTTCQGNSAVLNVSGLGEVKWYTSSTSSVAIGTGQSFLTPTLSPGTHVFHVESFVCNNSTGARLPITVTVNVIPNITMLSSNTATICPKNQVILSASGANTYTWSTGLNTTSISVTPTISSIYTVSGTDLNGCVNKATYYLPVFPVTNVTVAATPFSICYNSSSSSTLSAIGAQSYTWSNGALSNSVVVLPTVSTIYTVSCEDLYSCITTKTVELYVQNPININISGTSTLCSGGTGTISANGFGIHIYNWNTGATTNSIVITPTSTITYTVTGTNTITTCSRSVTKTITVMPTPTISVSSSTQVCLGNRITLFSYGANTYTWNTGAVTSTISVTPTSTTNYTITGKDANGCVGTATTQVFVNPTPTVSIFGATPICQGTNISLISSGADTYTWSTNEVSNSITVSPNTTTIYTVTGSDANNCIGTSTAQVSVNLSPTLNINNASICEGQTYTFTPSGAISYTYSGGNDIVSPSSTTDYTITGIGANGCVGTITTQVVVNPNPIIDLTTTGVSCIGTSANITASGATSYSWTNGAITNSISVTPTVNTTYTVTGIDASNCSSTKTVEVIIDNTCSDVWPGDANSDGTADNLDVLELGLHYTQTGTPRASVSNSWQSFYANNWTGTISNGKNVNHSDCNGDGAISVDDTLAIFNNYGLTHAFKQNDTEIINPQLSIMPDQSSVVKGSWGSSSIYLGDMVNDITNVNGVAYSVDFDNTLIEPNSIWIEYINSFINAGDNLHFRKLDFINGKIYTATTHTLSNNVSGNGKIAVLHYQIKSNLGNDAVLNFGLTQANQSSASGNITPLTSGTASVLVVANSVGVNNVLGNEFISLHPNPTSGLLNIKSTVELQKVEVLSVTGQVVMSEQSLNNNTHVIDISKLANGAYILNVYQNNRVIGRQRVVLNK